MSAGMGLFGEYMRPTHVLALLVAIVLALGSYGTYRIVTDPQNAILISESGAPWIKEDVAPSVFVASDEPRAVFFRYHFYLEVPPTRTSLVVKAFREYTAYINRGSLEPTPGNPTPWITSDRLDITSLMRAGGNEILIVVKNSMGPPALMAYSEELGISTGEHWTTWSEDLSHDTAVPITHKLPFSVSEEFPDAVETVLRKLAFFLVLFSIGAGGSILVAKHGYALSPSATRWIILVAWIVLCVNNITKIPTHAGFDSPDHYDYIEYVARNAGFPLQLRGGRCSRRPSSIYSKRLCFWFCRSSWS